MRYKWDFFISHAGGDISIAENLYTFLASQSKPFLDSKELILGDTWDQKIAEAQRQSLITIILVSSKTELAYYQRDEIAVAIQMARNLTQKHRVIPIFVPGYNKDKVPNGLTIIHSLTLSSESDIETAANELLETLRRIRKKGRKIKKVKDSDASYSLEEVLNVLDDLRETFKAQLFVFNHAKVTPQDCDECIRKLLGIIESSISFLISNDLEVVTNQIVSLYKYEEDVVSLVSLIRQFRKISIQLDSEDTKQQIVTGLQNLIKDIDSLIPKIKG